MYRIIYLIFISCLCLFSCKSQKTLVQATPPPSKEEEVIDFAEQKWDSIAKKIPEGMEEAFGFENREEIENSTMGDPIKMYYWQDENPVESSTYRVPVLVDGKMVSLLSVSAGETMNSGDFGGSQLAQNIQLVSDGYRIKISGILRIHLLSSDFLIFEENQMRYFIPMTPETLQNLSQRNVLKIDDIRSMTRK